jgi:hypothetical protein
VVSGNIGETISPYPLGTTLKITPRLLRTPAADGSPPVDIKVERGRKTLAPLPGFSVSSNAMFFDDVQVTSDAVIGLNRTLIALLKG